MSTRTHARPLNSSHASSPARVGETSLARGELPGKRSSLRRSQPDPHPSSSPPPPTFPRPRHREGRLPAASHNERGADHPERVAGTGTAGRRPKESEDMRVRRMIGAAHPSVRASEPDRRGATTRRIPRRQRSGSIRRARGLGTGGSPPKASEGKRGRRMIRAAVPRTRHQAPGTRHRAPGTRSGTVHQAPRSGTVDQHRTPLTSPEAPRTRNGVRLRAPAPAPRTAHRAPRPSHHAPGTAYGVPRTGHRAPAPGTGASGTGHQAPGTGATHRREPASAPKRRLLAHPPVVRHPRARRRREGSRCGTGVARSARTTRSFRTAPRRNALCRCCSSLRSPRSSAKRSSCQIAANRWRGIRGRADLHAVGVAEVVDDIDPRQAAARRRSDRRAAIRTSRRATRRDGGCRAATRRADTARAACP